MKCSAEVVATEALAAVEWEKVALLLWQAPLPDADTAKRIAGFIERGGQVLFFPPRNPGPAGFQGIHWTAWIDRSADVPVESWRGDQDLLAQTQSGGPLPVGQLQVRKYCGLAGELTALATLRGGATLLGRITTSGGGAYFSRQRRPSAIRLWPQTESCSTCWCSGRWRRVPRSWATRAADGRRSRRREPGRMEAPDGS